MLIISQGTSFVVLSVCQKIIIMNFIAKGFIGERSLYVAIVKEDFTSERNVIRIEANLGSEKIDSPGRKYLLFC